MEISLPWCLKGGHRCANSIMTHPDTNRPFTVRARGFQAELSSKVQLLCCISLEVTHVMRSGHIKSTSVAEQESFSFVEHLGNRWWCNARVGSLMIGDGHEWCNCLANYTIFFQIGVEAPSLLSSNNPWWPITCRKPAAQATLKVMDWLKVMDLQRGSYKSWDHLYYWKDKDEYPMGQVFGSLPWQLADFDFGNQLVYSMYIKYLKKKKYIYIHLNTELYKLLHTTFGNRVSKNKSHGVCRICGFLKLEQWKTHEVFCRNRGLYCSV